MNFVFGYNQTSENQKISDEPKQTEKLNQTPEPSGLTSDKKQIE